jgi:oxalate decarboxylase/phosphoglucose isomerase-like protein (cupin superfamily)
MKDWKEILLDDASMWPQQERVELPPAHVADRGAIQPLVDFPMKNVSLITSKKGTVRSNHYHVSDWHYMYVLSGSFDYFFRPTGTTERPKVIKLRPGEMVFTSPMQEHATVFLEDTMILVASRNPRDQEIYEADVKRVTLIDPATLT